MSQNCIFEFLEHWHEHARFTDNRNSLPSFFAISSLWLQFFRNFITMAAESSSDSEKSRQTQIVKLIRSDIFQDAATKIMQVHDDLKIEVDIFERERNQFLEISKKLDDVHFPPIIKLNVGGKVYHTTMETLKKDSNSMLALMFSGRFKLSEDDTGAYFIDRDGKLFRHVLNFLRTGKVQSRDLPKIKDELLTEAEFYQVKGLIEILSPIANFKESKIWKEEFNTHLEGWLPDDQWRWKLIYSGCRDGWTAPDFHRCCDGKSPTITSVKTTSGYIFGGYTDQAWVTPGGMK